MQDWSNTSRCTNQQSEIWNEESCKCVIQFVCRIRKTEKHQKGITSVRCSGKKNQIRMCELTPATPTFSTLQPNKTLVEMIGRFTECHPSLYLFQKAGWLTAGVQGGLACGQIYDFNQQPSPLMKCLAGAVLQNGVRGHVLWRRRCTLNARGGCVRVCAGAVCLEGWGRKGVAAFWRPRH